MTLESVFLFEGAKKTLDMEFCAFCHGWNFTTNKPYSSNICIFHDPKFFEKCVPLM
jgi:hypothetical protein